MIKKIINLLINMLFIGILILIGYYYFCLHKYDNVGDSLILDLENYATIENIYVSPQSVNLSVNEEKIKSNTSASTPPINQYYRYYYNQLDDNAKLIYSNLEYNLDNLKTDNFIIDFSTKFNGLLNTSGRNGISK